MSETEDYRSSLRQTATTVNGSHRRPSGQHPWPRATAAASDDAPDGAPDGASVGAPVGAHDGALTVLMAVLLTVPPTVLMAVLLAVPRTAEDDRGRGGLLYPRASAGSLAINSA